MSHSSFYPRARGVCAGRAGHVRGDGERHQHDVLGGLDPGAPGLDLLASQQQPYLIPRPQARGLHHYRQGRDHHRAAAHHVRQVRDEDGHQSSSQCVSLFSDPATPECTPVSRVTPRLLTSPFMCSRVILVFTFSQ